MWPPISTAMNKLVLFGTHKSPFVTLIGGHTYEPIPVVSVPGTRSNICARPCVRFQILAKTEPKTKALLEAGVDLSQWFVPQVRGLERGSYLWSLNRVRIFPVLNVK
jgi:hypothetical protein